ncbi:MAG: 16S rRNA (cytosine(967)-C(5))-methyltransferase RsmB [Clostridia bacterium]|nr:16S rRNA (cytosine(967)-C(5))-methyltransferase RsmB [Clostridia bacterium]
MSNNIATPRSLAYELLQRAEKSKQYSNIALDHALEASNMSNADKRLASVLFYGVTERKLTLDYRIAQLSSRKINELDEKTLCALRLGLYQLMYLDRVPAHAAINETVSLCPKKSTGFVNAILRAHTRTQMTAPSRDDLPYFLSVTYSVGRELAEKLIGSYGEIGAEEILNGFYSARDTTLRVNTLKISKAELSARLGGAEPTKSSPTGLYAKGSVRELYGFDDGFFFVQDEASQICVEVLDGRCGELVLDICSCPGSKSFGTAIKMNNEGKILSFDLHENKLSLVRSGAERLGISIIETRAADGRHSIPELIGAADRVLCDVPCSGFGVLAKKPELRYKDPAESEKLPSIQRDILDDACQYVKRGGVLVYSTCTILPEENEKNILAFLDAHPEFELYPWRVGEIEAPKGFVTLFPHLHGTDGFFIAKLIRK